MSHFFSETESQGAMEYETKKGIKKSPRPLTTHIQMSINGSFVYHAVYFMKKN